MNTNENHQQGSAADGCGNPRTNTESLDKEKRGRPHRDDGGEFDWRQDEPGPGPSPAFPQDAAPGASRMLRQADVNEGGEENDQYQ